MKLTLILFLQSVTVAQKCRSVDDPSGVGYVGTVNQTRNGRYGIRQCVPWYTRSKFTPSDGKDHSFCRNPDNDKRGPWCYVKLERNTPNYGYCNIPVCTTTSSAATTTKYYPPTTTYYPPTTTDSPTSSSPAPKNQCGVYTNSCSKCVGKAGKECTMPVFPRDPAGYMRRPVSDLQIKYPSDNKAIGQVVGTTFNAAKYGRCNPFTARGRVTMGVSAKAGLAPWQVCLREYVTKLQRCGGTLVTPNFVITAAHCMTKTARRYLVTVGHTARDYFEARIQRGFQETRIDSFARHHGWNSDTVSMDMAVLKLRDTLKFEEFVQPACLPPRDLKFNTKREDIYCMVTGWGDTDDSGKLAYELNAATLKLFNPQECNDLWNLPVTSKYQMKEFIATDGTQVCFGYEEGRIDTCNGDSGGPLVCLIDQKWTLFGVVSYGPNGCAVQNKPGVYSRVSHPAFYDWIQDQLTL